ncbi:hypothetical protein EYF80_005571 [Liparis tanakae]|uniref:Uncharacterized protein n=1 Tax=Liparis tanakae TaxID=230148 RepID=A0A4Z2J319_9TELE|nr:hypothetical protein EYF80_005571 [Liparis tanakae]
MTCPHIQKLVLRPVLRPGSGHRADPPEALHWWVAEGAWVGAPPLGAVDPVAVGGLEGQPWVLELRLEEAPQKA